VGLPTPHLLRNLKCKNDRESTLDINMYLISTINFIQHVFPFDCKLCLVRNTPTIVGDFMQSQPYTYSKNQKNAMVLVRERSIPTERKPLVGEVIAIYLLIDGATSMLRGR
jgi:hypothetical protein